MSVIVLGALESNEYMFGIRTVEIETDHKLLEIILTKLLYQAPARLHKMIMTVQKYPLSVKYRPGKSYIAIADTLSRAYLPEEADDICSDEFEVNIIRSLPISEDKIKTFKQETVQDPSLRELKRTVEKGWQIDDIIQHCALLELSR